MPFACEDCGEIGARMKILFEIRLCGLCSNSSKYKLVCKSKIFNEYLLTWSDLDNYFEPPKKYLVQNPHYRSGPPMTLYKVKDIEQVFLSTYNDLIVKIGIHEPNINLAQTVEIIKDYYREQKNIKKQEKYYKILDKYNIGLEQDLPIWIQNKLSDATSTSTSGVEYEKIIISYVRFNQLYKLMKRENLVKYIDNKICHNYIYQIDKSIMMEQIPNIIKFMLNKKNLIKQAVKKNNIDTSKYSQEISQYINSFDPNPNLVIKTITNDLDTLIEYINNKENDEIEINLRTNEFISKLKL